MKPHRPSITARRVAMRRAAHQRLDAPLVFEDPIAARLLDAEDAERLEREIESGRIDLSRGLRAFVVARSRYAEDQLAAAVDRGVRQYVVLGAGMDTFAYRNPHAGRGLRVFEVDFPSTQAWKRARLAEAGIAPPASLTFAPLDFESRTLADGLRDAGFDATAPAFVSWLGVVPYLTGDAIDATLRLVGGLSGSSAIVFDYGVPPDTLTGRVRDAYDAMAARVAAAGEPFRTFFEPAAITAKMRAFGFGTVEDAGPVEINARYFDGRADGLRVSGAGRLLHAIV